MVVACAKATQWTLHSTGIRPCSSLPVALPCGGVARARNPCLTSETSLLRAHVLEYLLLLLMTAHMAMTTVEAS